MTPRSALSLSYRQARFFEVVQAMASVDLVAAVGLTLPPSSFEVDLKAELVAEGKNSRGPFWASLVAWADVDATATAMVLVQFQFTDANGTPQSEDLTLLFGVASSSMVVTGPRVVFRDSDASAFKVVFTLLAGDIGTSKLNYVASILPLV